MPVKEIGLSQQFPGHLDFVDGCLAPVLSRVSGSHTPSPALSLQHGSIMIWYGAVPILIMSGASSATFRVPISNLDASF